MFIIKIVIKSKKINHIIVEDNYQDYINIDSIKVGDYYIMKFFIKYEPCYSQHIKIKWNYNSNEYFEYIYIDNDTYKYKYIYDLIQSNDKYKDFYIEECC